MDRNLHGAGEHFCLAHLSIFRASTLPGIEDAPPTPGSWLCTSMQVPHVRGEESRERNGGTLPSLASQPVSGQGLKELSAVVRKHGFVLSLYSES